MTAAATFNYMLLLIHLSLATDEREVKLDMGIFFFQTNVKSPTQSFHKFNFINET